MEKWKENEFEVCLVGEQSERKEIGKMTIFGFPHDSQKQIIPNWKDKWRENGRGVSKWCIFTKLSIIFKFLPLHLNLQGV